MPDRRRCSSAFLAMKRASREYGSPVMGSTTSQIRKRVLCDRTGSIVADSGSGMSSMSLSSIDWNPRMLEPSNPSPSLKLSTSSSPRGRLKCCQVPGRSTNLTSTTSTPSALALSSTSRGLVLLTDFVSTAMNTLHEYEDLTGLTVIVGRCSANNQVRGARTGGLTSCVVDTMTKRQLAMASC